MVKSDSKQMNFHKIGGIMSFDFLAQTGSHKKMNDATWMHVCRLLTIVLHTDLFVEDTTAQRFVESIGSDIGLLLENGGYKMDADTARDFSHVLSVLAEVVKQTGRFQENIDSLESLVGSLPDHYRVLEDELVQMGADWRPECSTLNPAQIHELRSVYRGIVPEDLYSLAEFLETSNGIVIA